MRLYAYIICGILCFSSTVLYAEGYSRLTNDQQAAVVAWLKDKADNPSDLVADPDYAAIAEQYYDFELEKKKVVVPFSVWEPYLKNIKEAKEQEAETSK